MLAKYVLHNNKDFMCMTIKYNIHFIICMYFNSYEPKIKFD